MRVGLYPGTFDPITLGHIDIIRRAARLVDKLVIGVAINRDKGPLFGLEERVAMIEAECASLAKATGTEIAVHPFENLLIDCARDVGAQIIVRGLRAVADFEYEYQMVGMNRQLDDSIETVFFDGRGRASGDCQQAGERNRPAWRRREQVCPAAGQHGPLQEAGKRLSLGTRRDEAVVGDDRDSGEFDKQIGMPEGLHLNACSHRGRRLFEPRHARG